MTKSPNETSADQGLGISGMSPGIADRLRQLYRSVQDEAIPDRFLSLLEKLDEAEQLADQNHRVKDSAQ